LLVGDRKDVYNNMIGFIVIVRTAVIFWSVPSWTETY